MSVHRYFYRPEGPKYDSLGQRPRFRRVMKLRPEGPQSGAAWCDAQPYRAPLARRIPADGNPGRCPGLRNDAPLARKRITMRKWKMNRENEITKGRNELEGLLG